jgi:hypothetical protein
LGEIIERAAFDSLKVIDEAKIQDQMRLLAIGHDAQDRVIDYLARVLNSGDVSPEFVEPIQQLQYALEHPDDPPKRIRDAIDRLGQHFQTEEEFRAWSYFEWDKLRSWVEALDRAILELNAASRARHLTPALTEQFPDGFKDRIGFTYALTDDPEPH